MKQEFEFEAEVRRAWNGPFVIDIANNGHFRVTLFNGDQRRRIQTACTRSDRRGLRNFRTRLRRKIKELTI